MKPLDENQVIANLSQQNDTSAQYYAAWWLGKMRSKHSDAVPLLLKTLANLSHDPVDPDRRGVALNSIRALGLLCDSAACDPLIRLLASADYIVREEAARSLGNMKVKAAITPICQLLTKKPKSSDQKRIEFSTVDEPYESLLEALGNIGVSNPSILDAIIPFSKHPRPLIQAAACRALLQLMKQQRWATQLERLLKHPEPLVRRGVLLDLGAAGWIATLPAIEAATVEASLKLVALRGLAEEHSGDIRVFNAMDRLL
ncbi:HEAT repeat domain-containing protein [Synechococcus sp. M16CYN]|uniref:HEAT repeat domain-containing protein n=1 Tax=Synechococcus sp. M16CYN TaxID=3103139 RepID=UPI00324B16F6